MFLLMCRHVNTSECSRKSPAAIYSSTMKITCPSPILMTSFNDDNCLQDSENDKENSLSMSQHETPQGCFLTNDRMALVRSSTARGSLRTSFDHVGLIESLSDISVIKNKSSYTKTPPSGHDDQGSFTCFLNLVRYRIH